MAAPMVNECVPPKSEATSQSLVQEIDHKISYCHQLLEDIAAALANTIGLGMDAKKPG